MTQRLTTDFAYLAFNFISGTPLAHGKTAAHAALQADEVAPEAPIKIIVAGAAGLEVWKAQINLRDAVFLLENENEPVPSG